MRKEHQKEVSALTKELVKRERKASRAKQLAERYDALRAKARAVEVQYWLLTGKYLGW